ncbi:urease accessory protein UreE [Propylenella binzhouense]|uniref:Urease accessory protein UreE n=1 Tax=Propylenella binzhouense TaxID=2555902 RepID=A0A964T6L4_9HYPH|nr:urease accessory protein UreE [Propylenella binzhouense]MYZ49438.1 urease accessory protein UreE [Propylenella binzhouense]
MLLIERVLGSRLDPAISAKLHELEHQGLVDEVNLATADLARRRMRVTSRAGRDVAIQLSRAEHLFDGAVLHLDAEGAILVRVAEERWLRLTPRSIADAVALGYHAGNLHWRVRFEGEALLVGLEAPVDDYLERLGDLVTERRVIPAVVASAEAA